jgi:chorismate dehydratase
MEGKLSLVLVNYLNAMPFIKGMETEGLFEEMNIRTETPARCASAFESGEADVALIPAGALHGIEDYRIISNYCIGCDGEVRTVCIFSHQDIRDSRRLLLDNHSRTSVLLARLIVEKYFGLQLPFHSLDVEKWEPEEGDAILMIGDKVFEFENQFQYRYDLGSLWKEWTGLPFVFAVWVARKNVSSWLESKLNQSFSTGIASLPEIARELSPASRDLSSYYTKHIQYDLDDQKRKALQKYLQLSASLLTPRDGIL